MFKNRDLSLRLRKLSSFLALFLLAIFVVGGCNDDSDNGGGLGGPDLGTGMSQCEVLSDPCSKITEKMSDNTTHIECVLDTTSCVFNFSDVVTQLKNSGYSVSDSSTLWMGAWGGMGGTPGNNGGVGGPGGYVQFVSSISDIKDTYGTDELYYFIGKDATSGIHHCGGSGGAATMVTREDLTLNPATDPTSSLVLMIAGGGGGGSGGQIDGCTNKEGLNSLGGGIAFGSTNGSTNDQGYGCQNDPNVEHTGCGAPTCGMCIGDESGHSRTAEGGGTDTNDNGSPIGGQRQCCNAGHTVPTGGNSGFGGLGGKGGDGTNCTEVEATGFLNATGLSFTAGQGGSGGGDSSPDCLTGGGAGGGGWGGGGAASWGNEVERAGPGGGGGSFTVQSTKTTSIAPSSKPGNPCDSSGCVVINIIED